MMAKNDAWQFLISDFLSVYFVIGRGPSGVQFGPLLYIQLTISFVIGRKRAVRFRKQRLGTSSTLDVTGNHVMYDRGV